MSNSLYGQFNIGVPLSRRQVPVVYDYKVIAPPVNLPITLDELKANARIALSFTDDDAYLTMIIRAVAKFFEKETNRILINTTFRTYRDCFPCCDGSCIELRRAIVAPNSVEIEYKKGNAFVVFPTTDYYTLDVSDFPGIYLVNGKSWPSDADKVLQAVKIEFIAGYGATSDDVDYDVKVALLQHATSIYANRGDCDESSCASFLPSGARDIYTKSKVVALSAIPNCRCTC